MIVSSDETIDMFYLSTANEFIGVPIGSAVGARVNYLDGVLGGEGRWELIVTAALRSFGKVFIIRESFDNAKDAVRECDGLLRSLSDGRAALNPYPKKPDEPEPDEPYDALIDDALGHAV